MFNSKFLIKNITTQSYITYYNNGVFVEGVSSNKALLFSKLKGNKVVKELNSDLEFTKYKLEEVKS